jgi:hypothetical protein
VLIDQPAQEVGALLAVDDGGEGAVLAFDEHAGMEQHGHEELRLALLSLRNSLWSPAGTCPARSRRRHRLGVDHASGSAAHRARCLDALECRRCGTSVRRSCRGVAARERGGGVTPAAVRLPSGYIAVLPAGHTIVVVGGTRYYYVGGVHYRAEFCQGRTVDVRVRL